MLHTSKKQLCSHIGLQEKITNTNYLRYTIIPHLQHSKVTRSIRCEELLPWCNMQCNTNFNYPHTLVWYEINRLMVIKNNKIITSSSSNTIIIIIFKISLFRLTFLAFVIPFPLITTLMYVFYFVTIMTLQILVSHDLDLLMIFSLPPFGSFFWHFPPFSMTCTSVWDEKPRAFLHISLARIPPLAVSKEITPIEVKPVIKTRNVSQDSGKYNNRNSPKS